MAGSTKLTLALVLCGLFFIVFFFWSVFLSGTPLLTEDIWQAEKSMSKNEALAWRKTPGAYKAPALDLTPAMNPVAIAIAHWSSALSFPRSSKYTLQVKNSGGEKVYEGAIGKNSGIQCCIKIIGIRYNSAQILLHQFWMVLYCFRNWTEYNTGLGQFLSKCGCYGDTVEPVSYTHLRANETLRYLV